MYSLELLWHLSSVEVSLSQSFHCKVKLCGHSVWRQRWPMELVILITQEDFIGYQNYCEETWRRSILLLVLQLHCVLLASGQECRYICSDQKSSVRLLTRKSGLDSRHCKRFYYPPKPPERTSYSMGTGCPSSSVQWLRLEHDHAEFKVSGAIPLCFCGMDKDNLRLC
jgi:hypothetical protein